MLRTIFALLVVLGVLAGVACGLQLNGTGTTANNDEAAGADAASNDAGGEDDGVDGASNEAGCDRDSACGTTPVQLTAGGNHYCVRTRARDVYCWGRNDHGELGVGDVISRARPTRVAIDEDGGALPTIEEVGAGQYHTCIRASDGALYCSGQNYWGQLGRGLTLPESHVPLRVGGLIARRVAAGGVHTCAIDQALRVQCWGRNDDGELGYLPGSRTDAGEARCAAGTAWCNPSPTPAGLAEEPVTLGLLFQSSCAIVADGGVRCWGFNAHGELSVAPSIATPDPVSVAVADGGLLAGATSVNGFYFSGCATVRDAGASCWGYAIYGNLGNTTGMNGSVTPARPFGTFTDVAGVAAGLAHTCVVARGRVHCVGWNGEGALGNGVIGGDAGCPTFANGQLPDQCVFSIVDVGLTFVAEVAAGATSTCVRTEAGKVLCWGENIFGELGHPPGSSGDVACRGSQGNGMSHCNPLPTEVVFGP